MILEEIANCKDKLRSFCKEHKKIFLYGAGKMGEEYLNVLKEMNIEPNGFIITEGTQTKFLNLSVMQAKNAKENLSADDGIIAAFAGANEELIRNAVGMEIQILLVSKEQLRCLSTEVFIKPMLSSFPRNEKPLSSIDQWNNILLIRMDVLGDAILSTAFVRELHKNCPQANIDLVVRRQNYFLFKNCPYVSRILLYDSDSVDGILPVSKGNIIDAQNKVREFIIRYGIDQQDYDSVINLCPLLHGRSSLESLLLMFFSHADCLVGRVNSFTISEQYCYSLLKDYFSFISYETKGKHEVAYMLDILKQCGGRVVSYKTELWLEGGDYEFAKVALNFKVSCNQVLIALGLVGSIGSKNWPPENYLSVARNLAKGHTDTKYLFVLLGGKEAAEAASIIQRESIAINAQVLDMTGKTSLSQAASVLSYCDMYIGADTGILHMAAAVGTPVLEISIALPDRKIGDGAIPERMGPWGVPNVAVCPPKALDGCSGICRYSRPHCITQIPVSDVVEQADKLLKYMEERT